MPIINFEIEENKDLPPLYRPKICWWKIILNIFTSLILTGGISTLIYFLTYKFWLSIICFILLNILIVIVFLGEIIICLTRIYQRYAKEKIRRRCVYSPSCSEYMILSIKKYGAFKGFKKGIKRLKRCHPPHGGIDNP
jgi:putative membrane protein insertion efficiency factor